MLPLSAILGVEIPDRTRICLIRDGKVYFSEKLALPYEPMIGTIGTAPEIEELSSGSLGRHGGNMDFADICPMAKVYLPVNVSGALLYVGDVHVIQGDGEISGTGVEMPAKIRSRSTCFDQND
jgi:amidase